MEKCYLDLESIKELGEGQAVIVRQHTGGKRTIGAFLIDAWCRGVRDAFYVARMEESDYEDFMDRLLGNPAQHLEEVPYEVLHNWVFGAVEYAAEAGLAPHKDFAVARYLLEDDEDERFPIIEYEFGLNGKHHLVCNSYQELERLKPVLDANLGKGNYTWGTNPFGVAAQDEDWDDDEDEEDDDWVGSVDFRADEEVFRLTLRIELANVKPPVWRKVEVPSNMLLDSFHELIQTVMGWENAHLHAFRTKERNIEEGEEWDLAVGDLLEKVGSKFTYEYDFGDGWVHKITLQKMEAADPSDHAIRVLGGKGACPPEDIGGPWIYSRMVELLLSGDNKRLKSEFGARAERLLDEDFDPAWFDLEEVQEYVGDMFGE
ncbi:MAG: plasmid pRiA4b ORF-3 family protein [Bacteroidales bacterium]|nr:plasmid pRiA4b ORF-3 family protein [Bacteroidales bacterium]